MTNFVFLLIELYSFRDQSLLQREWGGGGSKNEGGGGKSSFTPTKGKVLPSS